MLLALDSLYTPRPWRPQLGFSNVNREPVNRDSRRPRCWEMRRSMPSPAKSSPLPRSAESIMPLFVSRSNSAFGRAGVGILLCAIAPTDKQLETTLLRYDW